MLGTTEHPVLDAAALDSLLRNTRIAIANLGDSFVQMVGPFTPRVGRGDEDAIAFTEETAGLVWRYFRAHGVTCLWFVVTADYATSHSLVLANSAKGVERALRMAKKATRQARARLEIRSAPPDA